MRLTRIGACIAVVGVVVVVMMLVQGRIAAQRGAGASAQGAAQASEEPTIEELRKAVSQLRGGRIPRPTSYDAMTDEQKAYVKGILSGPRGDISGSLGVMVVSPGLGAEAQTAIGYARFAGRPGFSSVPTKLNELAILMGARAWTAQYAWHAHARYAVNQGLSRDVVEAVRLGKRPAKMDKDVETVFNFCAELLTKKSVSDANFQATRALLGGDRGVVDLVGTLGLYQMVAMMMVTDQMPLPKGVETYLHPVATLFTDTQ